MTQLLVLLSVNEGGYEDVTQCKLFFYSGSQLNDEVLSEMCFENKFHWVTAL